MPAFTISISKILLKVLAKAIRQEEKNNIQIGKEVKISLFADIISYIENSEKSTK